MKRVLAIGVLSLMSAVAVAQTTTGGDIGSSSQPARVNIYSGYREDVITEASLINNDQVGTDSVVYENFELIYKLNGEDEYDKKIYMPNSVLKEFAQNFCRIATGGSVIDMKAPSRLISNIANVHDVFTAFNGDLTLVRTTVSEIAKRRISATSISSIEMIVCSKTNTTAPAPVKIN